MWNIANIQKQNNTHVTITHIKERLNICHICFRSFVFFLKSETNKRLKPDPRNLPHCSKKPPLSFLLCWCEYSRKWHTTSCIFQFLVKGSHWSVLFYKACLFYSIIHEINSCNSLILLLYTFSLHKLFLFILP